MHLNTQIHVDLATAANFNNMEKKCLLSHATFVRDSGEKTDELKKKQKQIRTTNNEKRKQTNSEAGLKSHFS